MTSKPKKRKRKKKSKKVEEVDRERYTPEKIRREADKLWKEVFKPGGMK